MRRDWWSWSCSWKQIGGAGLDKSLSVSDLLLILLGPIIVVEVVVSDLVALKLPHRWLTPAVVVVVGSGII